LDKNWSLLDNLSDWLGLACFLFVHWGLADRFVDLLVEIFEFSDLTGGENLGPLREMVLELCWVFLLKLVEVGFNVTSKDVFLVYLGVKDLLCFLDLLCLSSLSCLLFWLFETETWEALNVVRNIESTVACSLKGTEDTVSSGGTGKTDIQEALEWSAVFLMVGNRVKVSVNFGVSLVHVSHTLGGQQTASNQEASGVCSGVVGQTSVEAVLLEIVRVSRCESHVTGEGAVVH